MQFRTETQHSGIGNIRIISVIALIFLSTAMLSGFFFVKNRMFVETQLRQTLRTIVGVGALQFDADELAKIDGPEDMESPAFRDAVRRLYDVQQQFPGIEYAYLMRRTDDPRYLSFIADAELYTSTEPQDTNENGVIDLEEQLSLPGDTYDISDVPAMQHEAFLRPTTDQEFTADQWGTYISAYAPIYNADGAPVAILGIDMDAENFLSVSWSLFSPALFLLMVVFGAGIAIYIAVLFWKRRLESLKEFDRERSALINLAMHQLGAPLAIFRWWIEILCEKCEVKPTKEDKEICEQLQEGVKRMTEVMSSLEEVSTFEHEEMQKVKKPTSMQEVVRTVVKQYKPRIDDKKMDVTITVPDDIMVYMDSKLIAAILRELISNAIDYSPKKSHIYIAARVHRWSIEVTVRDTGCGIPKEDQKRIFDRLTRGANASKYKPVGNGLGLFLVKQIIERANGKISVHSVLDEGTTMTFTLPRKP